MFKKEIIKRLNMDFYVYYCFQNSLRRKDYLTLVVGFVEVELKENTLLDVNLLTL